MSDNELESWQNEWQRLGQTEASARQLVRRAHKDMWRMRAAAAGEVLGAACSTTIVGWLLLRSHGAIEVVCIAALILLFNGAWLTHYFGMRKDVLSPSAGSTKQYVELTRARLLVEQRWNHAARRWTLALCALALPWSVWAFASHFDLYRAAPWRAVVGFGGAFGLSSGLFWFFHRKRVTLGKKLETFERQVAELELS